MKLLNQTRNIQLLTNLEVATSIFARMKGLLGRRELIPCDGLWIRPCNSIHTFFMNFPIDALFLNREMKIVEMKKNLVPGRLILPVWGARSVIECRAGQIEFWLSEQKIESGDILYVGH